MRKTRYMRFPETRKKEVFQLEWSVVSTIAYRSSKIQTEIDLAVYRSLVALMSSCGRTLGVKTGWSALRRETGGREYRGLFQRILFRGGKGSKNWR